MKKQQRSHCPVNYALEQFGDTWSLLIIRDIAFWGKKTFKEFLESRENIATNILTSRLERLTESDIIMKKAHPTDKRKSIYELTEKGIELIPALLEIAGWGTRFDSETTAPKAFVEHVYANREKMFKLIGETLRNGGSLFVGENSVISKMKKS